MFFPQPYRDVLAGGPENRSRSLALTPCQVATGVLSAGCRWRSAGVNRNSLTADRFSIALRPVSFHANHRGNDMRRIGWGLVALIGAFAVGGIALHRGETINAMWIIVAAICVYSLGYRFYSAWVATKVLCVDSPRATPAIRPNNGRDFMPNHRWIVSGHHFAPTAA